MRFKLGKCFNSLNKFKIINFFSGICKCFSKNNNSTCNENNNKRKKYSIRRELKLIYYTLCYNESNDALNFIETCFSPIAEYFSQLIRWFGRSLVFLVWILTLNMFCCFYIVLVPELLKTSWYNFGIHFILGNWLAVNTFFHWTMGWLTEPGYPPTTTTIDNVVSMCRKCVAPKPPRTHHCSICKKCVLKMDHHCPWFNNCIGFYNHRYFFLFLIFLIIDILYLETFGFHYYQLRVYPNENVTLFGLIFGQKLTQTSILSEKFYYKFTTIEFFIIFAVWFAIVCLATINGYIISRGATNIELKSMSFPCFPSTYDQPKNVYDLGFKNNWQVFLGFNDFKSFFFKVILPSTHKPLTDGVNWTEYLEYPIRHMNHVNKEFPV